MFHLSKSTASAARSTAVRSSRRRFAALAKPNPQPDTRPPAPWGAKPGYKKWQPVPDEVPSVNLYRFWGYKLFEGFFVGLAAGIVISIPYAIIKERQIRNWHSVTEEYLDDLQKNRVEPMRAALEAEARKPWWFELDGTNATDLSEMARYVRAAQADDDTDANEILTAPKPWDAKTETQYRESMLNFSEYPNYYNIAPDFSNVGKEEEEEDDDDDDDE